jgi:hypothetical protein
MMLSISTNIFATRAPAPGRVAKFALLRMNRSASSDFSDLGQLV